MSSNNKKNGVYKNGDSMNLKKEIRTLNLGRVSGLNKIEVINKFSSANEEIKNLNLRPVNPLKLAPYWMPSFLRFLIEIILLLTCRAIYVQKDRVNSFLVRITRKLWFAMIYQYDLQEINALKINEIQKKRREFVSSFLKDVKIRFELEDKRASEIMKIALENGIRWRNQDMITAGDYFPANGFLYVYQSEKDGNLYFAHGGSKQYFERSGEKEVSADTILTAYAMLNKVLTNIENEYVTEAKR